MVSGILAVSLARLGASLHFLLPCTALGRSVLQTWQRPSSNCTVALLATGHGGEFASFLVACHHPEICQGSSTTDQSDKEDAKSSAVEFKM